jgi:membrane fusion protein, multidrug efflux system
MRDYIETNPKRPTPKSKRMRWVVAGVGLCAALGVVTYGIITRNETEASLAKRADREALPQVTLVSPQQGPKSQSLTLPGTVRAWYTAPIYAQVSGYVQKWYKDYGAPVKAGDLLATIDTPALDQQYEQAKAAEQVAQADYNLAVVTAARWQSLVEKSAVSVEDKDVKTADATAAQARLDAAKDNVRRYAAMEKFKRIIAPFDGVVTSRDTDVGDYVDANGGDAGLPGHSSALFQVSDIHTMRVFVSVPQAYSAFIGPRATATLSFTQFPNQAFEADFETSAKSFDLVSRTVLVELLLPNPKGQFWPGAYVDAHFEVPTDSSILVIPEQAILFRSQGLQVCLVDAKHIVHLQDIKIGRNFGSTVQVTWGLKPDDKLIANPSDGLLDGERVHITQASKVDADDEDDASD